MEICLDCVGVKKREKPRKIDKEIKTQRDTKKTSETVNVTATVLIPFLYETTFNQYSVLRLPIKVLTFGLWWLHWSSDVAECEASFPFTTFLVMAAAFIPKRIGLYLLLLVTDTPKVKETTEKEQNFTWLTWVYCHKFNKHQQINSPLSEKHSEITTFPDRLVFEFSRQ